jgi:hypothetical protein
VENTISNSNYVVVFVFVATGTCLSIHCLETGCITLFIGLFHSSGCTRHSISRICLTALTCTLFGEHGVSSVRLNNRATVYYVPGEFRYCRSKLTTTFYLADRKIADDPEEVTLGFANKNCSTMSDLSKGPDSKADPIQMPPLSFSKVSTSCGLSLKFCFHSIL